MNKEEIYDDMQDFLELDRKGILSEHLRRCVDIYKEAVAYQAKNLSDHIDGIALEKELRND